MLEGISLTASFLSIDRLHDYKGLSTCKCSPTRDDLMLWEEGKKNDDAGENFGRGGRGFVPERTNFVCSITSKFSVRAYWQVQHGMVLPIPTVE